MDNNLRFFEETRGFGELAQRNKCENRYPTPSYEQIATSTSFSNHTESSSGTTREVPLEESESDEFELLKREFAIV